MEDFEAEIKKDFLNEALMNLEEVESSFMELESASDTKPLLDKIFRLAHNLKGGSRAVGFGEVAEFTHQLESLVLKLQKGEIALSSDIVTILLRSNDRLVEMLTALKADLSATSDNSDLLSDIQGWLSGTKTAAVTPATPVATQVEAPAPPTTPEPIAVEVSKIESEPAPNVPNANAFFPAETAGSAPATSALEVTPVKDEFQELAGLVQKSIEGVKESAVKKTNAPNTKSNSSQLDSKEDEIVRVNLSRINMLNDYVGELIVLQSVVQQQSMTGNKIKLQASIRQMAKLSKDIQGLSMSLRMLPVKPLVQKLQRVVRDTAKALGKEVEFKVNGEQMEIDKSVLDRLADPLIHILRNAVDHGLELPVDRTKSGKSTEGTVELSFLNEGNHLVIEVKDDGKGINGDVLRKKAIEKRLISEGEALTEKQLVNLIFHPGFSTKTETSEISGRGVGMDVVKTNVEKIGGHVDISTVVGTGSTFKLQIPLSLAVVDGLVVTSESSRFVVPLSQVQETINLKSQKVFSEKLGVGWCFELRGTVVPLFFLEEALGDRKTPVKEAKGTALIVSVEDRPIALVVSDILRAQQIVIKPFTNGIIAQKGWVGTCVLGDGLPTLILSPVDLLSGRVTHSLREAALGGVA